MRQLQKKPLQEKKLLQNEVISKLAGLSADEISNYQGQVSNVANEVETDLQNDPEGAVEIAKTLIDDIVAKAKAVSEENQKPIETHPDGLANEKAADGKATKIIIPSELQSLAGLVKSAKEVIKED